MLQEGLSYPTKGEEWIGRMAIGGVLGYFSFLLVPLLPYYGYQVAVLSSTAEGERVPPDFENWLGLSWQGLQASVVAFVYVVLPNLILGGVVVGVAVFLGGLNASDVVQDPRTIAGAGVAALAVIGVLVAVVELAIVYLFPAAFVTFAVGGSVVSAFSVRSILGLAFSLPYFLAMFLPPVVGFVVLALSLTVVGTILAPAVAFWGTTAATRIFGIAYREVHGIPIEPAVPAGAGPATRRQPVAPAGERTEPAEDEQIEEEPVEREPTEEPVEEEPAEPGPLEGRGHRERVEREPTGAESVDRGSTDPTEEGTAGADRAEEGGSGGDRVDEPTSEPEPSEEEMAGSGRAEGETSGSGRPEEGTAGADPVEGGSAETEPSDERTGETGRGEEGSAGGSPAERERTGTGSAGTAPTDVASEDREPTESDPVEDPTSETEIDEADAEPTEEEGGDGEEPIEDEPTSGQEPTEEDETDPEPIEEKRGDGEEGDDEEGEDDEESDRDRGEDGSSSPDGSWEPISKDRRDPGDADEN